ncbi:VCBS repeat-containing protein [Pendulispora rubella]|uniref:VCBS repeat-containing protein n=1 Tax=Pendulispora rubella TaxID=2741070 RepID=A0ABZ2L7S5_9BACT
MAFRDYLDVADVDGDGRKELVATSSSLTQVFAWNDRRAFSPNEALFKPLSRIPNWNPSLDSVRPVVTSLLGQGGDALLFSAGQISVWLADAVSHTLEAVQYPSVMFEHAEGLHVVFADTHTTVAGAPSTGDELYAFRPGFGAVGHHIALLQGHVVTPVQRLRESPARLAGDVQVRDVDGDGLPELLYAFEGNTGVDVFFPKKMIPPAAPCPGSAAPAPDPAVRVPSGYAVGPKGILVEDLDGDGKLDILIHIQREARAEGESTSSVVVAYGTGKGTFHSSPGLPSAGVPDGHTSNLSADLLAGLGSTLPLAAGQLTNFGLESDPFCDFVLPDKILFRIDAGTGPSLVEKRSRHTWQEAKIDDFDHDGSPDVVARSNGALVFYHGTGKPMVMSRSEHAVSNITGMIVGDFDGDLRPDAACSVSGGNGSELRILYDLGHPEDARTEKDDEFVRTGHFSSIERMASGYFAMAEPSQPGTADGLADIVVVGRASDPDARYLSLLQGSGSRRMLSPLELDRLIERKNGGQDGGVESLALAVGKFHDPDHPSIAALGRSAGKPPAYGLWQLLLTRDAQVVPGATTHDPLPKQLLTYPARLQWDKASLAALDLDPDSVPPLDELVLAVPPAAGPEPAKGALVVAKFREGTWIVESIRPLGEMFDPGLPWKVQAVDIDGDGHKDLVALFQDGKEGDGRTRVKLDVYFNDRTGTLKEPVTISVPDQDIVDGAWLHADPNSTERDKRDIVVLTRPSDDRDAEADVFLLTTDTTNKAFAPARSLLVSSSALALRPITARSSRSFRGSIAAGDIDGDGVDDIVYSIGNSATLLKGTPSLSDTPRRER